MESEGEFNADAVISYLECPYGRLEVCRAVCSSIYSQIVPAHTHGHIFSAHENIQLRHDVNVLAPRWPNA